MNSPTAVIDTNVVVAGLLTAEAESPTVRILDGMRRGAFPFLLSTALLAEYREVLMRPKIRKVHGLSEREIDLLLTEIATHAIVREPEARRTPGITTCGRSSSACRAAPSSRAISRSHAHRRRDRGSSPQENSSRPYRARNVAGNLLAAVSARKGWVGPVWSANIRAALLGLSQCLGNAMA